MAEAEVTIQYRDVPTTAAYQLLIVSLPILIIFFFWSVAVFVALQSANYAMVSLIFGAEIFVLVAVTVSVILLSDQTIFVTREGISLPFVILPSKSTRTHINWSEMCGVEFRADTSTNLILLFQNNRSVGLDLKLIDPDLVEELVIAIDVWAGGGDAFPALLEARSHIRGDSEEGSSGYTELWGEELARRFGPTNFIPLEPGDSLKGKDLVVIRQMAFGGMSAIYLVENKAKETFVLKESVVPEQSNPQMRGKAKELLSREAGFLGSLSHPRIARILDHFVENEKDYLL